MMSALALLGSCAACDEGSAKGSDRVDSSVGEFPGGGFPPATTTARSGRPAGQRLADWDATRCGDDEYQNARMERHPGLIGRAPGELEAAFGAASETDRFRVRDAVGTFRGGVGSRLPGGAAANADRIILEKTWTKSGCNFTVRFYEQGGRWRAIDGFEYSVGADF